MFVSALEQFKILPLVNIYFGFFDFSVTNSTIMILLVFFFLFVLSQLLTNSKNNSVFFIFKKWLIVFSGMYSLILGVVVENIGITHGAKFFPFVFSVFLFILSLNLIGLVPYTFTVTSHFIATLVFSLFIFLGINILTFLNHGLKFFSLFLPSGTSVILGFLLVPIELISYIFRPISLAIRLFANIMAGHTLLKIIAGLGFVLMTAGSFGFLLHYLPIFMLVPLFLLEVGVSFIQAFVFSLLVAMYINSAVNLH
jgi:ATP synthase subunit 6